MPEYKFTDSSRYPFKSGDVFLGRDRKTGRDVGITIEKHGIVVATTRTGKGASFIIPNLKRWTKSLVIIDPKGENCAETWRNRLAMGQTIALIDPFGESIKAGVPEWARRLFKTSFNPLDGIGLYTPRARERISAITNALVVVHDPKHAEWTDGTRKIIAGAIAFTLEKTPPEFHHLGTVRGLLKQEPEDLESTARDMIQSRALGGLANTAGSIILKALTSDRGLPPQLLDKAQTATEWLDSPELAGCLSRSDFSLSDLASNKLSLYLVLNADDLETYAGFLRLFIQSMLQGITNEGIRQNTDCLFILDEFYSLGKFDKIAEVMGRMAGFGVHVIPIIQNVGQLQELYGKDATTTFFGNADFEMFFGDGDPVTLNYISTKIGNFTISEVATKKPVEPTIPDGKPINNRKVQKYNPDGSAAYRREGFLWLDKRYLNEYRDEVKLMHEFREKMTEYHASMAWAGKPRLAPSDISALVGKPNGQKVAASMIVFAKAADVLNLKLAPFFEDSSYAEELSFISREKPPAPPAPVLAAPSPRPAAPVAPPPLPSGVCGKYFSGALPIPEKVGQCVVDQFYTKEEKAMADDSGPVSRKACEVVVRQFFR